MTATINALKAAWPGTLPKQFDYAIVKGKAVNLPTDVQRYLDPTSDPRLNRAREDNANFERRNLLEALEWMEESDTWQLAGTVHAPEGDYIEISRRAGKVAVADLPMEPLLHHASFIGHRGRKAPILAWDYTIDETARTITITANGTDGDRSLSAEVEKLTKAGYKALQWNETRLGYGGVVGDVVLAHPAQITFNGGRTVLTEVNEDFLD